MGTVLAIGMRIFGSKPHYMIAEKRKIEDEIPLTYIPKAISSPKKLVADIIDTKPKNKLNIFSNLALKDKILRLDEIIKNDPKNVDAISKLASLYLNVGELENAREYSHECLSINKKDDNCHSVLINTFLKEGEFEESYTHLEECLKEIPTQKSCLAGMVDYYQHSHKYEEAERYLDLLDRYYPNTIWAALIRANYFENRGIYQYAIPSFKQACGKGNTYSCKKAEALSEFLKENQ